jgi:tetratricopeptide (TPR) repeat protein
VYRRPDGWELPLDELGPVISRLAGPDVSAVRDTSTAYTHWLVDGGAALRVSGDLGGARKLLAAAAEHAPDDPEAHYELGLVHLFTGRLDDAKASLLQALSADPFHGETHYNLGLVLEREGDLDGAETEYRAAALSLVDPVPAHARLGALLARRGRFEEARDQLETIRRLAPGGDAEAFVAAALGDA